MKSHPEKIIVRCPNWVGDLVMATPALDCLRSNFPNTELVGLMRGYVRKVVEDGPWFDTIINGEDKNLRGFWELVKTIRHQKPDAAIVFPNSFQSALSCWSLFISSTPREYLNWGLIRCCSGRRRRRASTSAVVSTCDQR